MITTSTQSTDCSTHGNHEDVAVIVGRFQTPVLHEGHKDLISRVKAAHKQVVIFVGVSQNKRSRRNPLDFEARRLMILQEFAGIHVQPLSDTKDDNTWSNQLDAKIRELFPFASVRLYGGRDSFLAHYRGSLPATEIESTIYTSATRLRDEAGHSLKGSPDWRAGVIYGAYNQYPKTWQTVDIAPVRWTADGSYEVLLARKPGEKEWRFIGGFVDPSDTSLEHAARREVTEEAHIAVEGFEYVCSHRIDDWRYKEDVDKVLTTLFAVTYVSGAPQPDDDIEELGWFVRERNHPRSLHYTPIVPAHCEIYDKLLKHLEAKYAKTIGNKSVAAVG